MGRMLAARDCHTTSKLQDIQAVQMHCGHRYPSKIAKPQWRCANIQPNWLQDLCGKSGKCAALAGYQGDVPVQGSVAHAVGGIDKAV